MSTELISLYYNTFLVLFKFLNLNDTYKMMLTCEEFSKIKDDIWVYYVLYVIQKNFGYGLEQDHPQYHAIR